MLGFNSIACNFGMKIKTENTIVDKWLTRPKIRAWDEKQDGAAEEFCTKFTTVERM